MARLLHGRPLAESIHQRTKERAAALRRRDVVPCLTVISVDDDPAGRAYGERLERAGRWVDVDVQLAPMSGASEATLIERLEQLSGDPHVHGILLLTPLPARLDELHVIDHIAVEKDVEGMHPYNMGFLADGRPQFVPSTAEAVVELLKFHEIPLRGQHAVIVGRSTVIGRPAAYLLLREDATVTIAHKQTPDLARFTRDADILVVGVGRPHFLGPEMVRPGAAVVDAGINLTPNGIAGDVDTEAVAAVAGAISPVPGGLGAVTTSLLLRNVVTATERQYQEG
jgi:methylenetetrahydrofolate dehydrogenase (NADP+)/methenyltetrahydrofolate cyclohydrolase